MKFHYNGRYYTLNEATKFELTSDFVRSRKDRVSDMFGDILSTLVGKGILNVNDLNGIFKDISVEE